MFILVLTKSCVLKKFIYNFNYKTVSTQYEICQTLLAFKKPQSVALSITCMATKCPGFYCCT